MGYGLIGDSMTKLYIMYPDGKIYIIGLIEKDQVMEYLIKLFEEVPANYTMTKVSDTTLCYKVSFSKETRMFYTVDELCAD